MRAPLLLLTTSLAWATLGCEGEPTTPTPPAELPITQIEAKQVQSFCDMLFRCDPSQSPRAAPRILFRDQAQCETYLRGSRAYDVDDLQRAVAAGLIRYDGAAAARCIDDMNQCAVPTSEPAACKGAFVGTVAVGGACQLDEECAGDTYCQAGAGATMCPGTCTARLAVGTACRSSTQCTEQGLTGRASCVSPPDRADGTCRDVTTAAPAAEGAACGFDQATFVETACASGLYCHDVTRRCARPVAVGQPCADGDECAGVANCAAAVPEGPRTCQAVEILRTAGVACDEHARICSALDGLDCVEGTCVDDGAPAGPLGSPCRRSDYAAPCDAGLFCGGGAGATRTCQAQLALGEACPSRDACADGACVQGRCEARECRAL